MKNIAINTALIIVGLCIGNFIGGCIDDQHQLAMRLQKLEQKK